MMRTQGLTSILGRIKRSVADPALQDASPEPDVDRQTVPLHPLIAQDVASAGSAQHTAVP
jgi:hypothetical protein